MAETLKVGLIEVLEVNEGGVSFVGADEVVPFAGRALAAQAVETPVSPGQLEVRANVTIRYRIAPKP
jgi:uncharacterized protein YggE